MPEGKKILIAAGGTGGHLFPAQALARELLELDGEMQVLFAGAGLSSNRYFYKEQFPFKEVAGDSPFRKGRRFSALFSILKGIKEGLEILHDFKPDLIVGFGSFHSFPILAAAFLKRVPFALFESNAESGKVNRLLSKWAKVSATQFPQAKTRLRGKTAEVQMPLWKKEKKTTREEALAYFGLDPDRLTFLVFGGSQGASAINKVFSQTAACIGEAAGLFQILHMAGNAKNAEELRLAYAHSEIKACVKEFEHQMHYAWTVADLVICRAGAATIAEQIAFEVPALLIPYPYATDSHQQKNADFIAQIGGGIHLPESRLDVEELLRTLLVLLQPARLDEMRAKIRAFKEKSSKPALSTLIVQVVQEASL